MSASLSIEFYCSEKTSLGYGIVDAMTSMNLQSQIYNVYKPIKINNFKMSRLFILITFVLKTT